MKPELKVDEYRTKKWYLDGKFHREDGPAVVYANGAKEWWANGKLHRVGGPAIEIVGGYKAWCFNGKWHRVDGPAVERANGSKGWYLDGVALTKEEWFDSLSAEDKEKALFSEYFILG